MDEKTEELRDIFLDVSDGETVTESQAETPGSLTTDEAAVDEHIEGVVARMRQRYDFSTELDTAALTSVVRGFYAGADDTALGAALDEPRETVFRARMDLHLLCEDDTDAPFDLATLRDLSERPVEDAATDLGVPVETVRHYRRVAETHVEARQVSYRFQSEFEDALADAGLSTTMTRSVREDGLTEATEDIGSLEEDADVGF